MNTPQNSSSKRLPWWSFWPVALFAVVALVAVFNVKPSQSDTAQNTPTYPRKVPKGMAVATLGGGCFWSMEAMYKRLNGVVSAEPGYAGGITPNPTYEQVCSGRTGHAEVVNVIYDPKVISYGDLVEVLLTVLDPTTPNQQGPDYGTNYRSIVFARTPQERDAAYAKIKEIDAEGIWKNPVVTQVAPIKVFYSAEPYHQNYYDLHSDLPYCRSVIVPKLEKLEDHFGDKMKR